MTWYVVVDKNHSGKPPNPKDLIWTVSVHRDECGWNTDSGCDGYGMPKKVAQFLADAANEKEAREGVTIKEWPRW